jgi:tetratricopeptide (TPR) repeat protein
MHRHTSQMALPICQSVFHVQYERNPYFTGRDDLFETIRHKIRDEQLKGYKHRIALFGLGGVGKTQIALEYCFRYKQDYDYVFWMSSADETRLLSSFSEIATLTGSINTISDQTPGAIAQAVLRWSLSNGKWLFIFDNLDDISIIEGYLPPPSNSGHVLITTRNKNCDGIPAEGVEITPMNLSESVSLLLARSGLEDNPREAVQVEAGRIVEELGHLPLAIEQAAAYIRNSQNISEYLHVYRQNRFFLLRDKPKGNYSYQESVGTTWKISLDQLKTTDANAIKLIELLAFLNPDEILIEFLKAGNMGLPPELKLIVNNDFFLRQSLRELESYSLIRVWDEGRRITIHRLVQYVIRDDLNPEAQSLLATKIIQLALSAFPDNVEGINRRICQRYRAQVTAILDNIDNHSMFGWQVMAERLAVYLGEDGYYSESLKLFTSCLEVRRSVLGPEHPDMLRNILGLAETFRRFGRLNEAVKLNEECLEIRKKVLGPEHPETLLSMSNLAATYNNLGRLNEAVKSNEECLEIRKKVLGPEHPDTLLRMSNLAATYHSLGRFKEQLKLNTECLDIRKRVLGPKHPDSLRSMDGLAATYCNLGRSTEALKLYEECLKIGKTVLVPEHPNTLKSMDGLAATYSSLGRSIEASKLCEECMEIRKRVLGPEHPDSLKSMDGLAATYFNLGRSPEASKLYEECLEIRKKVFGPEHPDTLRCMDGLSAVYGNLGRPEEQLKLSKECLDIKKRVLGPEHPDSLRSMDGLAATYFNLGRSTEASKLYEECMEIRKRMPGPEHPDMLRNDHDD